jgi:hypothetical protein
MENPRKRTTVSEEAIGDGLGVFDRAYANSLMMFIALR